MLPDAPRLDPEARDIEKDEAGKERRQPAEPDRLAGADCVGEPSRDLRNRKPENESVEGEIEIEPLDTNLRRRA